MEAYPSTNNNSIYIGLSTKHKFKGMVTSGSEARNIFYIKQ